MSTCLFCKIIQKEIPAKIIFENEYTIAFLDINPIADGHTLVIPKKCSKDLLSTDDLYLNEVALTIKKVSNILNNSALKPWGFNYLSNQGEMAGQEIFHFHFHIIPKYASNQGLLLSTKRELKFSLDDVYKKLTSKK